jgi:hypothetical protein
MADSDDGGNGYGAAGITGTIIGCLFFVFFIAALVYCCVPRRHVVAEPVVVVDAVVIPVNEQVVAGQPVRSPGEFSEGERRGPHKRDSRRVGFADFSSG